MRWNKVTIVGVGLLGGSLGLTLRQRRLAGEVAGYVRRPARVRQCAAVGAVDYATTDLLAAVWNADLVVLCTPLAQMPGLAAQMRPALKPGALVTDVGSVKDSVVRELEPILSRAGACFVGSHPMAGAEKTGVVAARADLFENAVCVVTPTRRTARRALQAVERLWRDVGCRVMRLSPKVHDRLVSKSSHLPHMVAATLVNLILGDGQPPRQAALCATGFRDTTRVASGSPEMWRDIALANRQHLGRALAEFSRELGRVQRMIRRGDAVALARWLETAKTRRDRWCMRHVTRSPE